VLTAERLRQLLHYDPETGVWTWRVSRSPARASDVAGSVFNDGYRYICIDYRSYGAHRLAWLWMTGLFPPAEIDHINLDRVDNRWNNLRAATQTQNKQNTSTHKGSWTGVKGVSLRRSKQGRCSAAWLVQIQANGKTHCRTCHGTLDEAAGVYAKLGKELHQDFARTE